MLARASLGEEGGEAVVVGRRRTLHKATIGLVISAIHIMSDMRRLIGDQQIRDGSTHAQAVLDGIKLPTSITDLDTYTVSPCSPLLFCTMLPTILLIISHAFPATSHSSSNLAHDCLMPSLEMRHTGLTDVDLYISYTP